MARLWILASQTIDEHSTHYTVAGKENQSSNKNELKKERKKERQTEGKKEKKKESQSLYNENKNALGWKWEL